MTTASTSPTDARPTDARPAGAGPADAGTADAGTGAPGGIADTDLASTTDTAGRPPAEGPPLLEVTDLRTTFDTPRGTVVAVDGVSLHVEAGETLGIVGESGSGKTVLARSLLGLVPSRAATTTGSVRLQGRELVGLSAKAMRDVWGVQAAMVFQDPMTALNATMRVGDQITESLRFHLERRTGRHLERGVRQTVAERVQGRDRRIDVVALPVRPPPGHLVPVEDGNLTHVPRKRHGQLAAGIGLAIKAMATSPLRATLFCADRDVDELARAFHRAFRE